MAVLYDGATRRYVLQGGGGSAAARSLSPDEMGFVTETRSSLEWQEWDGCEWLDGPTNTPGLLQ